MEKAQQHMEAGQFAEAEAIYRAALESDDGNTQAVFMLALARRAQGDLDEAVELMERAGQQDPDNINIHYTLGTLHMSRRATDDARRAYLRALQVDPFHIDSHNGVAFVELIAGNYSAAERAANLALTEDDRNVQALVYLGTAKLEQNDTTKAIAYLQEALKESPEHQSAQVQLGRAFMADGKAGFAMQCFSNIVQADDKSAVAWEYLAGAQFANGLAAEAGQSYRRALSLGHNSPANLKGLAECEKALGNQQQAEQLMQMADEPEKAKFGALLTRAQFEISRGNPGVALSILQSMGDDTSEQLAVLKAVALEQMRNPSEALAVLKPLVDQGGTSAETQLAYARLLTKSGRESEADELVDTLLAGDEPPVAARIFRGFQMCRRGDEAGIGYLQEIENDAALSEVDQHRVSKMLATTLDEAGRFDEAAGHYSRLSGRLAQVQVVAESVAGSNRELLDSGASFSAVAREDSNPLPSDPVFLFAWPGSGWEWLASGLGAHPAVMLVADKPETQTRRRALISAPAGPVQMGNISGSDVSEAAGRYWSDLGSGGLEPGDRITVDTMWLSADILPTLATLFPAARVMVVRRDPRDMVFDWFRAGYSELQEMAVTYKDQLDALEQYRSMLDIEFIDVDGDALQSDALPELKKLATTLNISWQEAIGTQLDSIKQSVRAGRGNWSEYAQVLTEPLKVFDQ